MVKNTSKPSVVAAIIAVLTLACVPSYGAPDMEVTYMAILAGLTQNAQNLNTQEILVGISKLPEAKVLRQVGCGQASVYTTETEFKWKGKYYRVYTGDILASVGVVDRHRGKGKREFSFTLKNWAVTTVWEYGNPQGNPPTPATQAQCDTVLKELEAFLKSAKK